MVVGAKIRQILSSKIFNFFILVHYSTTVYIASSIIALAISHTILDSWKEFKFWSQKTYLHLISDLLFQSSGEEELQLQLALAMSKEEADEAVRALLQSLAQIRPHFLARQFR